MPPRAIFRYNNGWSSIENPGLLVASEASDVMPLLRQVESAASDGHYAVGYVAYEAASAFDNALTHQPPEPDTPLAMFVVGKSLSRASVPEPTKELGLSPTMTRATFGEKISRIKSYLREGDSYQVNFTHRHRGYLHGSAETAFASLYAAQPSPLAIFLQNEDFAVCSVSPELFFSLDGETICCEPMKGTRSRGRYPGEDAVISRSLMASEKDRAENLMIVDMIRNDLGRIAVPGSVDASELFMLRRLPTVWQQVSRVSAQTHAGLAEIFQALFPCASVTGAPRARTMQIIRELEDSPRGIYTGALGVVTPGRKATFSVGIRTLTWHSGRSTYGTGGGIVWDSDPEEEWQESLAKAAVLNYRLPEFELLETMRYNPESGYQRLDHHLSRMAASAEYFSFPFSSEAARRKLESAADENESRRVRLRLDQDGGLHVEHQPVPVPSSPVRLRLARSPISSQDIFLFHKTTHREVYEQARASVDDCDDVLLWNERGELTETSIFNLVLEIDGRWYTPPQSSGLLAGIYRQALLEEGRIEEQVLLLDDLARTSRVMVCNSLRGMLDAVVMDNEADIQYRRGGSPS